MILFEKDWDDYPDAIADYKTKNKSFVRYCALLHSMGVKNYLFPLQLHDPRLQGVDPHSKDLTVLQMALIVRECKINPFYFIREVARIPGGSEEEPITYNAHRGNIAALWTYLNHITYILIQIRQTGKSVGSDFIATWVMNYAATYYTYTLLTKDDKLRASNLERLKLIELALPVFLRMRKKGDIGNTEELHVSRLHNKLKGHLPNKNPKMANMVARGETSGTIHVDEAAFFWNIGITLPTCLPATNAAFKLHERKGEPYGIFLTTTAGKKDDPDGKYVFEILQEAYIWTEKLFDSVNREDLIKIVLAGSKSKDPTISMTFNHRQLGFDDEWLRNTVHRARSKGEDAERDFGNRWTSGGVRSPLTAKQAETIRKSEVPDFFADITNAEGYTLRWYKDPRYSRRYLEENYHILSLDGSDGMGADGCSLHLRNIKTGETTAAFNVNELNLIALARFICAFLVENKNVLFVPERKGSAIAIIDYLTEMLPAANEDPFKRIFSKVVQEQLEYKERFAPLTRPMGLRPRDLAIQYKKFFGFNTSGSGSNARSELYGDCFNQAVELTGHLVYDKVTIDQINSLELVNGRIDHPAGGHDDSVISWLLTFWVLIKGKHLDFYGINSYDILSENTVNKSQLETMSDYELMEQRRIKEELQICIEMLKQCRDETLGRRIEHNIKTLSSKLAEEDREVFSVDQLLMDLRESRSRFKRY